MDADLFTDHAEELQCRTASKKKLTYERDAACSLSPSSPYTHTHTHKTFSPFSLVVDFVLQFKSQMDEVRGGSFGSIGPEHGTEIAITTSGFSLSSE
jgi:hypothetical protein